MNGFLVRLSPLDAVNSKRCLGVRWPNFKGPPRSSPLGTFRAEENAKRPQRRRARRNECFRRQGRGRLAGWIIGYLQ